MKGDFGLGQVDRNRNWGLVREYTVKTEVKSFQQYLIVYFALIFVLHIVACN